MRRSTVPEADEPGGVIDYSIVRDYTLFVFRALSRHTILAASCVVGVVLASVLAMEVLPKRYLVEGSVLVQRSPVMGLLSNPGLNREGDAPTRAARELVLRRDNLISLCKQTDFVRRYLAHRAPAVRLRDWAYRLLGYQRTDEELLERLADTLEKRLWVTVGNEGKVTIGLEWSDDEAAYQMVQAAMQSFLETRHASEVSIVSEAVTILEEYSARVRNQIGGMVEQLEEKERRLRIVAPRRVSPTRARITRDEDLVRLESTLAARRRALADLEEFRRRRLAELQSQLQQQITLYAPQHPVVISTRQNMETLSAASPQVEDLRTEVAGLEREVRKRGGMLGDQADALRVELPQIPPRLLEDDPRVEYERGQVRLLFRQYSSLTDRLDAARIELETTRAAFKHRYSVISPPQMPKRPLRPYPPMIIGVALIAGVALALFAAAAIDLRSGLALEGWQIERRLGVRVLVDMP